LTRLAGTAFHRNRNCIGPKRRFRRLSTFHNLRLRAQFAWGFPRKANAQASLDQTDQAGFRDETTTAPMDWCNELASSGVKWACVSPAI
jgi:hypothetical protein